LAQLLLIKGMMKKSFLTYGILLASLLCLIIMACQASASRFSYKGNLANFDGNINSLWSRIVVDKEMNEVIIYNPRKVDIRIFNSAGMETFRFGDNLSLYGVTDLDLGAEGEMYLVYPGKKEYKILRLDYKGEPLAYIDLKNFPEDFLPFRPNLIQYVEGMLYLADPEALNVVVTDLEGSFQKGYHFESEVKKLRDEMLKAEGGEKDPNAINLTPLSDEMFGFCVDRDGSIFFTVPTMFTVFKYSPDGEMKTFGESGSAPGKFGVIASVTTDRKGNIYISDRLRSKVIIFDSNFNLLDEFGGRGVRPGSLIVPDDVAVDDVRGLIYVAQAALRGVSVFRMIDY